MGDFLNTQIAVQKQCTIKCDGKVNQFIVEQNAVYVTLELQNMTTVCKLEALAVVKTIW